MDIALISLLGLIGAIVIGGIVRVNVGILASALAWIIGVYVAEMTVGDVLRGFPLNLAAILFGITFLFGCAQQNGTLTQLAHRAIRLTRGRRALMPLTFFVLAVILSTIGPGNIGAVALLAPLAMATAGEMGISAFLITVMIANGANAGAFSPFAPTGIIANGLITQLGIEMNPWTQVYLPSLVAQTFVALVSYLLFGGIRLARQDRHERDQRGQMDNYVVEPWTPGQMITVAAIAALIIGVIFFGADPAFLAVALATLLTMVRAADQKAAFDHIPWDTIMMVCGVSVLIAILQTTGGIDLVTRLLAEISTAQTVTGVLAFFAGIVSAYSSSSGVVMPAFIAMVPGLLARLAGANPVALVSSINVGAHLVDVSPLSTLGALCITNAPPREDKERLFRNLLIYGLSMAVVGAGVCYVFFGLLLA